MGYPTASTYPEISGAASGTTPTEPTITVTGRVKGGTYTVSAGARSLSIGNPDGATLSTTVNDTSGAVAVTGDATTSPSWTAPSGGTNGEATQVRVVGTDPVTGLSSEFSFTEFIDGTGVGPALWTDVLDWSSSSEAFASGQGSYTIGGLSVTVSYQGSAGPASMALSSGVLTIEADDTDFAYLIIDLGEDFENVPLWAVLTADSVSGLGSAGAIFWQMCDDVTVGNAAGHWQEIIGSAGAATAMLGRYATGAASFVTTNNRTVTDITTTPTRAAVYIDGTDFRPSFDQGTASLPTTGADLGTVGPNSYSATSGAYTTTAARNQRYMHLQVKCNATIRIAAAKRN